MATIHFFLQGKGGCGKSTSARAFAEYLLDTGKKCICIDTDPVNKTLSGYKRLGVTEINVMSGTKIDPLKFDSIIETLAGAESDEHVIVDNGASSFIAFSDFLLTNGVPELLAELGHTLYIHTVVVGGDAQSDTVLGFASLAKSFGQRAKLVVWLNPYFGPIEKEGKNFETFRAYADNKSAVVGIVRYPSFDADTYGKNLADLAKARLTFKEALDSADYQLMTKQRFKLAQKAIHSQLGSSLMGI